METTNLRKTLEKLSKKGKRPRPERTNLAPPGFQPGEKIAFTLDNVFTKKECDELIRCSEHKGYEQALINVGFGRQELKLNVRNNQRCIIDSTELVDNFWERIAEFIPTRFDDYEAVGLNERLRFLRYDPGEYFKPHKDGSYTRENGERSFVTVQIYLNEGFTGGSTTFLPRMTFKDKDQKEEKEEVPCIPKIGRVLVFQHDLYHEGSLLKTGRKYAIRTDVMYRKIPQDTEAEQQS